MKVGDLVRFKVHHYHKSYGIGVVLGTGLTRLRAMFNEEQVVARFEELEVISEGR